MTITRTLFAASLLLAALPAQGKPSPFRFVPADSCFVMRMGAPAAWKQQFATAQVTKWLQGESLGPLVGMLGKSVDQGIGMLRESGKFDADLLEKMLADYKGEIVLSLQCDFAALAETLMNGEDPPITMTLTMTPDGTFDLAALAKACEGAIDENAPPTRDLVVGDHKLRGMLDAGGDGVTVPTIIDGHFVIVGGNDVEQGLSKLLANEGRWQGNATPHALSIDLKLGNALSMFGKFVDEQGGAPISVESIFKATGFTSFDAMTMTFDADGKHVVGDVQMSFGDGDRGIFAAMAGPTTAPKLLKYVPASSESFSVSVIKLGVIYDVIAKVWGELGEAVPMTFADVEAGFAEAAKVRLKEDLIAHLGDELMMLQDPQALASGVADEEDPTAMFNGSCFGIALRDGKAFGESLEKVIRSRGLHASRKTEEYQGLKVHRMRLAGLVEIEYAVTDDLLLVGVGTSEDSQKALRSILDTQKTPGDGSVPAVAKDATAAMPAGWNGISVTAMSGYLNGMMVGMEAAMNQSMSGVPDEMGMVMEAIKKSTGELKRLGIDLMVATTYTTANGFGTRLRW